MAKDPKNDEIIEGPQDSVAIRGSDLPAVPNVDKIMEFCDNIAKSKMFPNLKDKYQVLAVVSYGRELGIKPIMALQTIHWIPKKDRPAEGTLAIQSKVLLALAQQRGIEVTVDKKTTKECQLTFSRNKQSFTEKFTWQDVERAKLDQRRNYITYPEEMLFWRCVSKGLRVFDPGLALGIYTLEEVDAGAEQETIEVEPKQPEKKEEEKPDEKKAVDAEPVKDEKEEPKEKKPAKKKPKPKTKKSEPEPEPEPDSDEGPEEEDTEEGNEEEEKDLDDETEAPETPPEEMTEGEKAKYYTGKLKEDFYIRYGDKKKADEKFREFKDFLMDWQRTRSKPREFVRFNQFNHVSMSIGKGSDLELLWEHRGHVLKEWADWEKAQKKAAEELAETEVDDLS